MGTDVKFGEIDPWHILSTNKWLSEIIFVRLLAKYELLHRF